MRRIVAAVLFATCLPALAQTKVVPAANYTDLWWNPAENGWGVTITQHPSNQIWAIWYTYDPRYGDSTAPGNSKPLWINMPGGTWVTPTQLTGDVYVTAGVPYFDTGKATGQTRVGTFTFNFTNAQTGTFTYNISAPAGLSSGDPAFGLPNMAGTKPIERIPF
jgi:hypothetical protein